MKQLNKEHIIDYMIKKLEKDLEKSKSFYERTRQEAANAPGKMVSRYDTMGVEAAYLADGIAKRTDQLKQELSIIRFLRIPKTNGEIRLCSVVGTEDAKTGEFETYMILPTGAGGEEFDYEGTMITVISPNAPLSQSMFGKIKGDKIQVKLPQNRVKELLIAYVG